MDSSRIERHIECQEVAIVLGDFFSQFKDHTANLFDFIVHDDVYERLIAFTFNLDDKAGTCVDESPLLPFDSTSLERVSLVVSQICEFDSSSCRECF